MSKTGASDSSRFGELEIQEPSMVTMFQQMMLIRRFEEKVEELFVLKKAVKGLSHLYIGQEAVAVGLSSSLRSDDILVSHYRGHGHSLARGVPAKSIMAEIFGKSTGTCGGVGGSMHAAKYPEAGLMYATAIVGSGIPIAAGMALAIQRQNSQRVVAVCFGDGATNIGSFHEGLNIASLWKLPLILVCENNQYAMSMKVTNSTAGPGISKRAEAYGIPGVEIDGNDVSKVYFSVSDAVQRARKGLGPTLLEFKTYRIRGHGVYDNAPYRSQSEVEEWKLRDPITLIHNLILQRGLATQSELETIDLDVRRQIEDALQYAQQAPPPKLDEIAKFVQQ